MNRLASAETLTQAITGFFGLSPLKTARRFSAAIRAILSRVSEAIISVISLAEAGEIDLIFSEAHTFETEQNPHPTRKRYAIEVAAKATRYTWFNDAIISQAEHLTSAGIKSLDALHLSAAVEAGADYFCTCDDRFYRKATKANTSSTKVVTPLELIQELEYGD